MYDRVRLTFVALSRDLSSIRGDWRHFASGIAAEAAFVLLLASLSLGTVELIKWMGP